MSNNYNLNDVFSTIKLFFWYSCIPLILGLLVYLCFGSTETTLFKKIEILLGHDFLFQIRPDLTPPAFIRYHLSDGLWAFALTSTLLIVFHKKINNRIVLVITFFSIILYEWCQRYNLIKGTADFIDVVVMLIFALSAYFLLAKKLKL